MRVAMMLYAVFQLLEVSGPMDVFHEANRLHGGAFYEPQLVGTSPGPVLSSNGTPVATTECLFDTRKPFDIAVVPGSPVVSSASEHCELVTWLGKTGPGKQRLACISNGVFLLARAGVADRRWLTTHWRDAGRLSAEFPRVHVISSPGCLKDGNVYSSDGASAGIHLALSIVQEDLGKSAAAKIARTLLMQPR